MSWILYHVLCVLAAAQPPDWCQDKRDDCHRYVGRGPYGGGCKRHTEYMRVFCARTCDFCEFPEDQLQHADLFLDGTAVTALSARGVRRWMFLELPVDVRSGNPGTCQEDVGDTLSSCSLSPVARTHVFAARYYDGKSHAVNSTVYRWYDSTATFEPHQSLPTVGAWAATSFELEGSQFLAVASLFDGNTRKLNSSVYSWDASADVFVLHQELATEGAMDVEFISLPGQNAGVLVFAGHFGDDNARGECRAFLWEPKEQRFILSKVLPTSGAYDVEALVPRQGSEKAGMVLVLDDRADVYDVGVAQGELVLDLQQQISENHCRDAESFSLQAREYLALAFFRSDASYRVANLIFVWNSEIHSWIEVQRLVAESSVDVELLSGGELSESLLLVASQRGGLLHSYRFDDGGFQPAGSVNTPSVYNIAWHHSPYAKKSFLGIANFWD